LKKEKRNLCFSKNERVRWKGRGGRTIGFAQESYNKGREKEGGEGSGERRARGRSNTNCEEYLQEDLNSRPGVRTTAKKKKKTELWSLWLGGGKPCLPLRGQYLCQNSETHEGETLEILKRKGVGA